MALFLDTLVDKMNASLGCQREYQGLNCYDKKSNYSEVNKIKLKIRQVQNFVDLINDYLSLYYSILTLADPS